VGFTAGRTELPTGRLLDEADRLRALGNREWVHYELEYHRRLAFPVAAFLMAVIGMPLGASFRTRGRNFGLAVGLFIFIVYYSVYSLGMSLSGAGYLPPGPAVWAADAIALALALVLLKGINRSAAIDPGATLKRAWARLRGPAGGPADAPEASGGHGPAPEAGR
jgi:lipopolysaccharide export system permease protein